MYLSVQQTFEFDAYARTFAATPDGRILSRFWHPVAWSCAVNERPFASRLLGVDLVIYRTEGGIGVARDSCPHRGARLSMGELDAERTSLVCPMHGHHYAADGRCTRIPSMDDHAGTRNPPRMRLQSFLGAERYGIVWACLGEVPLRPLPQWPQLETVTPPWERIDTPTERWKTTASRHCESFNDVAWRSWAEVEESGSSDKLAIGPYDVQPTTHGLRMDMAGHTYDLTYPFASHLRTDHAAGLVSHSFDIASPVDESECEVYRMTLSNVPEGEHAGVESWTASRARHRLLVESQCPKQVPLNAAYEVSVPADRFSVQLRRDMVQLFGIGSSETTL